MKTLRVMTFNICHARGMDGTVSLQHIAEEIRRSGADVIGLQEVDRFLTRSHTADQPLELARLLDMDFCYSPSEDGHNISNAAVYIRENGKEGQYGNAILSWFPITAHQFYYLPGDGTAERRSLLRAEINAHGRSLTFFNTHLGLQTPEQALQIDTVAEKIKSTFGPMILLGDFNMKPDNPLLEKVASATPKVLLQNNVTTFAGKKDAIMEIDHIFTNLSPEQPAWTQPTLASDHHPVLAQLQLSEDNYDE
jgi:endonuclease/exonuclease/phosphatase family metal-dependent hydrolase